jgi:hypothetical protein
MIRHCPLCGPVEARVVSVDLPRPPDGRLADEYRCATRGHLFVVDHDDTVSGQALGDPGR